jgi:hypothetical protein
LALAGVGVEKVPQQNAFSSASMPSPVPGIGCDHKNFAATSPQIAANSVFLGLKSWIDPA